MADTDKAKAWHWQRWALGIAGALALYALLGFWAVPQLLRHQVPQLGQSALARQASVGDVRFNPFTLRLEAADLKLAEADGAPLLGIGRLVVEMQWRSVLRRAWSFAEIRLTAPTVSLAVAPDGRFNLAQLLDTLNRRPAEPSTDTALPRLVIEQLALEQGKLSMRDQRAGYSNELSPIDFALSNFSTLPDQSDRHTFTAQSAGGGKLGWKGTASVNPIRASGELMLDNVSLPALGVYLKSYTRATVAAGQLSAVLPYSFSYANGQVEARLAGARLSLQGLALAREGAAAAFASLTRLEVSGVDADLVRREAVVAQVRADGGKLAARRDAKGEIDLAQLMVVAANSTRAATTTTTATTVTTTATTAAPAAARKTATVAAPSTPVAAAGGWKLDLKQLVLSQWALAAEDATVQPPLRLSADKVGLQLRLSAAQAGADLQVQVADAALSVEGLSAASGEQTPSFKLAQLGFTGGTVDLAAQRAAVESLSAQGGQLQLLRDKAGQLNLLNLMPRLAEADARPQPAARPWLAQARSIDLAKFGADMADEASGIKLHLTDMALRLDGASSDLKQAVRFKAGLSVREGGQFSAQGSVVPASGLLQADLRLSQLALAPLQPLLAQHLKLKIAGGQVSAQGRLTTGAGTQGSPALRYLGGLEVAGLVLNEDDGELFAAWKSVGAEQLTASLTPNRLDVPELRITEANAKLIIENDRSFNAARLLVNPAGGDAKAAAGVPAAAPPAPAAPPPASASASASASAVSAPAAAADDPFPVRIRRVRLQDAKLDFTDLSLRPQFGAKIYELSGAINGLSSGRQSRSQIELDGRVDEFGSARIRGELNPFAPANNTDVSVIFKNVDMVSASPYTMKFAGYRIAQGKISLDLQYKLQGGQMEGANQIVIDQLTLGERVDSPDAIKLPLELAIAILKDSDGRIDLGLPVSGNINDPQFSYGAIIWKAIGNVLTKIVTAPFRALGGLLGISGEKLESIDFDPGSDRLQPPEREKLKQVAQILAKRAQLKLSVPAGYSEATDGAALRQRAVRAEVAQRAGLKLQPGEEPGPMDLADRAVRSALRELYAQRFGEVELDKQKKAAEAAQPGATGAAGAAPEASGAASAKAALPLWQRVGKLVQGEPQVADARAFYQGLQARLFQTQSLAPDALTRLATGRADAVLAALKEAGVDASRASAAAPASVAADAGKPVGLKLGLAAK